MKVVNCTVTNSMAKQRTPIPVLTKNKTTVKIVTGTTKKTSLALAQSTFRYSIGYEKFDIDKLRNIA